MQPSTRGRPARARAALAGLAGLALLAAAPPAAAQLQHKSTVAHMLRRTSFGVRPGQADAHSANFPTGIYAHLVQQIAGNLPETTEFTAGLADFRVPASSAAPPNFGQWGIDDLARRTLYRAAYSQNQLRELMTMFWEQHFNTSYDALIGYLLANPTTLLNVQGLTGTDPQKARQAAAYIKFLELESFRQNALGSFRDLLHASAKSPAMLIYLDNVLNKVPFGSGLRPNQNYSRELCELHTVGKDYFTEYAVAFDEVSDPFDLGYAFTGWTVATTPASAPYWNFQFDSANHTDFTTPVGPFQPLFKMHYTRLDPNIGPLNLSQYAGLAQGNRVLDYLARGWETRTYVCGKLIEFFVGYRPWDPNAAAPFMYPGPPVPTRKVPLPPTITEQQLTDLLLLCTSVWEQSGVQGNIPAVLATIFTSPVFQSAGARWAVVKSPLEYEASLLVSLDARLPREVLVGGAPQHELFNALHFLRNAGQDPHRHPSPEGYPIESFELSSTSNLLHRTALARSIHWDYVHPDPTGQWGGYEPGKVDWYFLRAFLPGLFSSGTPTARYNNLVAYLQSYPPAPPTLDLGSIGQVSDHVLDLLFQGDVDPASRALVVNQLAVVESRLLASLQALLVFSNPNINPSWPLTLQEHGKGITRFLVYAASLPQFQLK